MPSHGMHAQRKRLSTCMSFYPAVLARAELKGMSLWQTGPHSAAWRCPRHGTVTSSSRSCRTFLPRCLDIVASTAFSEGSDGYEPLRGSVPVACDDHEVLGAGTSLQSSLRSCQVASPAITLPINFDTLIHSRPAPGLSIQCPV